MKTATEHQLLERKIICEIWVICRSSRCFMKRRYRPKAWRQNVYQSAFDPAGEA